MPSSSDAPNALLQRLLQFGDVVAVLHQRVQPDGVGEIHGRRLRVSPGDGHLGEVEREVRVGRIHLARLFGQPERFLRVSADATIEVAVPVEFINQDASPGLKRGGVLNIVRHEIDLICPVEAIPDHITVDMTGFDVGESVHISHVKLPANVKPSITDRDFTVASVAAPSGLKSEENAAEAEAATAPAAAAAEEK